MTHSSSLSRSLTRDLTLSSEAPLAFCLRLFLQSLQWTGQSADFASVMGRDPRNLDLVDARNVLLRLGYNTRLSQIKDFSDLKTTLLPGLYVPLTINPMCFRRALMLSCRR